MIPNTLNSKLKNTLDSKVQNKNVKSDFKPLEKTVVEIVSKDKEIKGCLGFTWQSYCVLVKSADFRLTFLLQTDQESYLKLKIGDRYNLPLSFNRSIGEYYTHKRVKFH